MKHSIFISYRRADSGGYTRALYEALSEHLGAEHLFMDVDAIAPGSDFVEAIQAAVGRCDVLLAVIADSWLDAKDGVGNRRIDDPNDYVRLEIESALSRGIPIIPVLVGINEMPAADALPEPLRPLARRNAVTVPDDHFQSGVEKLLTALPDSGTRTPKNIKTVAKAKWMGAVGGIAVVGIAIALATISLYKSDPQPKPPGMSAPAQVDGTVNVSSIDGKAIVDALIKAYEETLVGKDEVIALRNSRVTTLQRQLEGLIDDITRRAKNNASSGFGALASLQRGNAELAMELYETLARESQTDPGTTAAAYRWLGALAALTDEQVALAAYQRASELDPTHRETWFLLGQTYEYAGDTTKARSAFARALGLSDAASDENEVERARLHLDWARQSLDTESGTETGSVRNPFGVPDVRDPAGPDVLEFARNVRFSDLKTDPNAQRWGTAGGRSGGENISGTWASRWRRSGNSWITGTAVIVRAKDRIFILYDDVGQYLIEAKRSREGTLVGRYQNLNVSSDSTPWVGVVVDESRIDGYWVHGRWDFQR